MATAADEPPEDIRCSRDREVERYDRVRPGYPEALFEVLFAALPSEPRIVEVGPGTGKATGSLLARGAHVTAVEIGPQLADFLGAKFGGADLDVVNASFEDSDLELGAFDAVVGATAYHWVDAQARVDRPLELLRPGGVLGVIEPIQVDSPSDGGYFDRVQPIYEAFGSWRYDPPKDYATAESSIPGELRASGLYTSVEVHRVPMDQTYSSADYRDLLLTYSGTQMLPEPDRTNMVDRLVAVIDDEFGGTLTRPLVCTLTLAVAP